jgi:hypothetical protein
MYIHGHAVNDNINRLNYKKQNPDYKVENSYKCKAGKDIDKSEDGSWYSNDIESRFLMIDRRDPSSNVHDLIHNKPTMEAYLKSIGISDKSYLDLLIDLYLKILRHPMYTKNNLKISKNVDLAEMTCQRDNETYQIESRKRNELYEKFKQTNSMVDGKTRFTNTMQDDPRIKSEIFGLCFTYILFDCQRPAFLKRKKTQKTGKVGYIQTNPFGFANGAAASRDPALFLKQNSYVCNNRTSIWEDDKGNLIRWSTSDSILNPISMDMIGLLASKGICNDTLALFHHPAFVKWENSARFKKTTICADSLKKHIELVHKDVEQYTNNNLVID